LQTQLKYYRKTQYFERFSKKFREIQVILSEDQLIWFYQTFLLKSRTQISPVVLTNHTEEFMKLKFVPNFISQNKSHKIFCKENFSKPVEKISNFLSIVIKIYQGSFIKYLLWGKPMINNCFKKYEELGPNRSKKIIFY
jgi:hypothetical protein